MSAKATRSTRRAEQWASAHATARSRSALPVMQDETPRTEFADWPAPAVAVGRSARLTGLYVQDPAPDLTFEARIEGDEAQGDPARSVRVRQRLDADHLGIDVEGSDPRNGEPAMDLAPGNEACGQSRLGAKGRAARAEIDHRRTQERFVFGRRGEFEMDPAGRNPDVLAALDAAPIAEDPEGPGFGGEDLDPHGSAVDGVAVDPTLEHETRAIGTGRIASIQPDETVADPFDDGASVLASVFGKQVHTLTTVKNPLADASHVVTDRSPEARD